MDRDKTVEAVVRALRKVNWQGSILGQTVAIRLGLSESDIEALELLVDTGSETAGRLAELMGLTTGAVTRMIDRLEQAGYVRRTTDPADRRRVVVQPVPERLGEIEPLLEGVGAITARELRGVHARAARAHQRLPAAGHRCGADGNGPASGGRAHRHGPPGGGSGPGRLRPRPPRPARASAASIRPRWPGWPAVDSSSAAGRPT